MKVYHQKYLDTQTTYVRNVLQNHLHIIFKNGFPHIFWTFTVRLLIYCTASTTKMPVPNWHLKDRMRMVVKMIVMMRRTDAVGWGFDWPCASVCRGGSEERGGGSLAHISIASISSPTFISTLLHFSPTFLSSPLPDDKMSVGAEQVTVKEGGVWEEGEG